MSKDLERSCWFFILVFAMFIWATTYPLFKYLHVYLGSEFTAFLRFFFATVAMALVLLVQRKMRLPARSHYFRFVMLGFFMTFPTILLIEGIERSSTIVSSIVVNTNPLFIALLAPLILMERISFKRLIGLLVGFVGVLFTVLKGAEISTFLHSEYTSGVLYLLAASFIISFYTIFARDLIRIYGGLYVSWITSLFGTLLLFAICVFYGQLGTVRLMNLNLWVMAITVGAFSTALPYVIWTSSMKHLDASVASSFKLFIPVFASIFGVYFFGELLTPWMIFGLLLTGFGVWMVHRSEGELGP